jgi:hypothetical protein
MVPRYATTGSGLVRGRGASYLWYTHAAVDARLVEAERVVERIFTASDESLRLATHKKLVTVTASTSRTSTRENENPHPASARSAGSLRGRIL